MSARVRTHVALPAELLRQIDELVGPRKRSEFIAGTLDAAVRRARVLNALQALIDGVVPEGGTDVPGRGDVAGEAHADRHGRDDWDASSSAADWVRASRGEESARGQRLWDDESA